jgi:hypothetical protein
MNTPFSLGASDELIGYLEEAGFREIEITQETKEAYFQSAEDFVRRVLVGSVVGRSGISLKENTLAALSRGVSKMLRPYATNRGLEFPMSANLVSALN